MCLLRLPTAQNDVFMTCFLSNKRSKTQRKAANPQILRSWRTKVGRMSEKQIKTHLLIIISVVLCLTVTSDLPVEKERSHQESASHKHPCFTSGHQRAPAAQLCRQPVRQQEVWGGSSYGWICSGRGSTHTHSHSHTLGVDDSRQRPVYSLRCCADCIICSTKVINISPDHHSNVKTPRGCDGLQASPVPPCFRKRCARKCEEEESPF